MSALRDIGAERTVIGAVLLDPAIVPELRDVVCAEHFTAEHRQIFEAICKLADERADIDEFTLARATAGADISPLVLDEIKDSTPSAAHWRTYARTVATAARIRRLSEVSAEISTECQTLALGSDEDALRWFSDAQRRLVEASTYARASAMVTQRELMRRVLRFAEERVESRGQLLGFSCGYDAIDEKLLGIRKQRLHIVAGKPGAGKSAFALNVLRNASRIGAKSYMASLEMGLEELGLRFLAAESRVPVTKIEVGACGGLDFSRLSTAVQNTADAPIVWPESPPTTIAALRAECQRLKRGQGLDLVIVDYLQLLSGSGDAGTREREVAEVSRGLKLMTTELDIAVIALSQLNRKKERHDEPDLAELRDSGAIEQDANVALFLWALNDDTEEINWKIAKNRGGALGKGTLRFRKAIQRFDQEMGNS